MFALLDVSLWKHSTTYSEPNSKSEEVPASSRLLSSVTVGLTSSHGIPGFNHLGAFQHGYCSSIDGSLEKSTAQNTLDPKVKQVSNTCLDPKFPRFESKSRPGPQPGSLPPMGLNAPQCHPVAGPPHANFCESYPSHCFDLFQNMSKPYTNRINMYDISL